MMSRKVEDYLDLTKRALDLRAANRGKETNEEGDLINTLDGMWYGMTAKERAYVEGLINNKKEK